MNAHNHNKLADALVSPSGASATYSYRTTDCPECGGDQLVGCEWSDGFADTRRCDECIRGQVEAACTDCGNVLPLNDEGACECCFDAGELPSVLFHLKWLCPNIRRLGAAEIQL